MQALILASLAASISKTQNDCTNLANVEFAVIVNLLLGAGVVGHADVLSEIDRQIASLKKQGATEVAEELLLTRRKVEQATEPRMTVIDGGRGD